METYESSVIDGKPRRLGPCSKFALTFQGTPSKNALGGGLEVMQ